MSSYQPLGLGASFSLAKHSTHKALCVLSLPPPWHQALLLFPTLIILPALSCAWCVLLPALTPLPLPIANPFTFPTQLSITSPMKPLMNFPDPRGTDSCVPLAQHLWHLLEPLSKGSAPTYLPFPLSSLVVGCIQTPYPSCLSENPLPSDHRFGTWKVLTKYLMNWFLDEWIKSDLYCISFQKNELKNYADEDVIGRIEWNWI